jgi:hypothetical protein
MMTDRNVHLIGSVPLADARTVFETVSAVLGPRLRWIPDGETGPRSDWVMSLEPVFAAHPALEPAPEGFQLHAHARKNRRYRLRPGKSPQDLTFDNLLYADIAKESYAVFAELKRQGKVPAHAKFQIDLVPAHSTIWLFLDDSLHGVVDPIYNAAVKREIDKIAAALPHAEIGIQFDVASAVFARLERNEASAYGRTKEEMQDTFAGILIDLGNHVPADIDLLFHLCYGDAGHRHVVEPTDMGDMVAFTNRLMRGLSRNVQLVHMPVPRDRTDEAYFAPLRALALKPETELCLGLVHYTDGIEGTRRRMAVAEKFVADFSIATECGFGRRDPATIPELLRIHAQAAGLAA